MKNSLEMDEDEVESGGELRLVLEKD